MELLGKVAIVTGSSRGIGRVISKALVRAGMHVTTCGRNRVTLDEAAQQLNGLTINSSQKVLAVQGDVSRNDDVQRIIEETMAHHGHIDVLINNAASGGHALLEETSEEDWDRIIDGTLKSVFLCSRAVLPIMKHQRSGYIINIGSWAGKEGMAGLGSYCAAKFGVVGLTQTLQQEGKDHNIRASIILPGATARQANSTDPERLQAEDVAKTVLHLLSLSDIAVVPEVGVIRRTSL